MDDDVYSQMMVRTTEETKRLNTQHRVVTENLGYLFHPSIANKIVPGCRIADVGTGTAAFLIELAKQVPESCELHGFDISDSQFPPQETLPANVSLRLCDAKKGFPSEFHTQYDLVHMRFLFAAMENEEDWSTLARNVLALLKPGGAIQWVEGSFGEVHIAFSAVPGGHPELSSLFREMFAKMSSYAGVDPGWVATALSRVLQDAGAKDVTEEIVSSDRLPETRQMVVDTMIGINVSVLTSLARNKAPGAWSENEVVERCERLRELAKSERIYLRYSIHSIVGFKG